MTSEAVFASYAVPGVFTDLRQFKPQFASVPTEPGAIARVVQGLLIHEGLTGAYAVTLSPERAADKQLHSAAAMLARALILEERPLDQARRPERRVVGVCRHFATLFVAVMRSRGIAARARCGFADYFERGKHLDHWVGEYWCADRARWVLVDPQIDDRQRDLFGVEFDPLDVPRDRFLVAGDAWRACRAGADPMTFGVGGTPMWGLVEVYGDLFQDLAALQAIELLPWGWYGLAEDPRGLEETALIDRLASISTRADAIALSELREMVAADPRLAVPEEIIAAVVETERAAVGESG
jgi:Transglutaminase-like superfamily